MEQQNPIVKATVDQIVFGMKDHLHPEVLNPRSRKYFRMPMQKTTYEALFPDAVWDDPKSLEKWASIPDEDIEYHNFEVLALKLVNHPSQLEPLFGRDWYLTYFRHSVASFCGPIRFFLIRKTHYETVYTLNMHKSRRAEGSLVHQDFLTVSFCYTTTTRWDIDQLGQKGDRIDTFKWKKVLTERIDNRSWKWHYVTFDKKKKLVNKRNN